MKKPQKSPCLMSERISNDSMKKDIILKLGQKGSRLLKSMSITISGTRLNGALITAGNTVPLVFNSSS